MKRLIVFTLMLLSLKALSQFFKLLKFHLLLKFFPDFILNKSINTNLKFIIQPKGIYLGFVW